MGNKFSAGIVPAVSAATPSITASAPAAAAAAGDKPKCKACCACPETKKARDQCIIENGEEKCGTLIEAHKQCMRDMGFNV